MSHSPHIQLCRMYWPHPVEHRLTLFVEADMIVAFMLDCAFICPNEVVKFQVFVIICTSPSISLYCL